MNGVDALGLTFNKMDDDDKELFNENFPDERDTAEELEGASKTDEEKKGWFEMIGDIVKAIFTGGASKATDIAEASTKAALGDDGKRTVDGTMTTVDMARN